MFSENIQTIKHVSHISSEPIHEKSGKSLISDGDSGHTAKSFRDHNLSFQLQWVSRTVMVQENNVDEAMKVLNGIMAREGMLKRCKNMKMAK